MSELRANMQRNKKYAAQGQYTTVLSPDAEVAFQQWVKANKVPFNPADTVADYDMRGFYKALQEQDPRAVSAINPVDNAIHYPDIWKTPYHKTFSNESQWAMPGAPAWQGNKLVLPNGRVVFDEEAR
jgi:hypothetical protein